MWLSKHNEDVFFNKEKYIYCRKPGTSLFNNVFIVIARLVSFYHEKMDKINQCLFCTNHFIKNNITITVAFLT